MITKYNRDNPVKNLPDAYNKGVNSNNAKLIAVEKHALDALRRTIQDVYDSIDLDNATGATLDMYGEIFGQRRGGATDEQYRMLIRAKIVRNHANGDHNSIVRAICATFGCEPSDLLLTEPDTPCHVILETLPFDALNRSNIDANTAVKIIRSLIPAGVTIDSMNFSGTFELGDIDMEYDPDKGLGNIEQTIGGTLGYMPSSDDINLPV